MAKGKAAKRSLDKEEDDRWGEDLVREGAAAGLEVEVLELIITEEPIPDPAMEAMSDEELGRIERVTDRMYEDPASLIEELEELVAQHPTMPMLRNHLVGALQAAGQRKRAGALIAETAELFPDYMFGFVSRVMWLLTKGQVEEARALLEPEGGPARLFIAAFAPHREVFHFTEVVCYTAMVGCYLVVTGRLEAADIQLEMCLELAPEHPQTLELERMLENAEMAEVLQRMVSEMGRKTKRRKTKKNKKKEKKKQ